MAGGPNRSVGILLGLFAVSFVARLLFGILVVGLDAPPLGDAANYDQIGANLASEGSYIQYHGQGVWYSWRAPLLPFLLAAVYYVAGHSFVASRLLLIVIGSLVPPVMFILTNRIFGRKAAVVAGAISAGYPFFILYSNTLLTETPLVLLICLLMIFLLRFVDRRKTSDICLAGVIAGLGCLTKASLLSFMPVCVIWLLIMARPGLLHALKGALLFILFVVAVITPWTYRNYLVHGELVPIRSRGGVVLWLGNNQWATGNIGDDYETLWRIKPDPGTTKETEIDRFFRREALNYIRNHPKRFILLGFKKIFHFWRPQGFRIPGLIDRTPESVRFAVGFFSYVPLFLLFVFGFAASLKQRKLLRDPGLLLLSLLIVNYTLVHAVFAPIPRYRQPVEPAMIAIGSWILVRVLDRIRGRGAAGLAH